MISKRSCALIPQLRQGSIAARNSSNRALTSCKSSSTNAFFRSQSRSLFSKSASQIRLSSLTSSHAPQLSPLISNKFFDSSTSTSTIRSFSSTSSSLTSSTSSNETPTGIRSQAVDLKSSPSSGLLGRTSPSGAPHRIDMDQVNKRRKELPQAPDRRPLLIAFVLVSIASWSLFASYANNKERLSTSVFRSVLVQLKDDEEVCKRLGEPVMLVPSIWGEPWVNGAVNMMQGKVDVSFKIQGSKGTATAYFTSIRRSSHRPFEVLRFLVIPDPTPRNVGDGNAEVDTEPISLLGEAEGASATSGSKVGVVHDDQGELSLKRL